MQEKNKTLFVTRNPKPETRNPQLATCGVYDGTLTGVIKAEPFGLGYLPVNVVNYISNWRISSERCWIRAENPNYFPLGFML